MGKQISLLGTDFTIPEVERLNQDLAKVNLVTAIMHLQNVGRLELTDEFIADMPKARIAVWRDEARMITVVELRAL